MPKIAIIFGSVLALLGIICFLAVLGQGRADIRDIGSASFSIGVLTLAFGVYLRARRLQVLYEQPASKTKKTDRLCSSCNKEPSVLFCRVHVLRLCPSCFEKHDDGANCSYVPAKRATAAYK